MDSGEVALKVFALEAELAATSPRIADLEARVSLLEAENARWRKAMPNGEVFGRLEEGLGGSKQKPVQAAGVPGLAYDSINEVGDGEEEGIAADASNGRSGEDGVPAVPTPRKRCGGGHRRIRRDHNVGLEGEKNGKNGELQVGVPGAPPSRKRALCRIIDSDEEEDDEDDRIPLREAVKKMKEKRMRLDDAELGEMDRRSTPATRRSERLAEKQSKKAPVEPSDHEGSEDDSGQDGDMGELKNDARCSEDSDSEMDYTLLKDVTLESNRLRVRVRITRISHYMKKYQPTGIPQLNFVMLEEQGDMMACQVPEWLAQPFLPRIKEGDVYYIHQFEVDYPNQTYRAVDHPCMAKFTRHTEISKDEHVPHGFPLYAYKISPYEVLRSRENNTVLMSDAIGLMLEVSDVETVRVNGEPRAVRNVYISDGRETAVVALWEAHANQFPAEILQKQMQQGPVVILFVAVTVKLHKGQLCLQGSKVCRWYPNAPIPEVLALQNSSAAVSHEARLFDTSPTQTRTVTGSTSVVHEKEKDSVKHVDMGNISEQASPAMLVAGGGAAANKNTGGFVHSGLSSGW